MRLAIIPARGGSKRIPQKNIRDFCGKPIIAWSIEAALLSKCFDRVIVSTDDHGIVDVARKYGAEVPFLRPAEIADDYTGTAAVVHHAIEWFEGNGIAFEEVCCIYATAPFVRAEDIASGLEILLSTNADYAFTVTSYPFPIQRAVMVKSTGSLEMFYPEYYCTRSQDLVEAYHDAGQFYWGRMNAWKKGEALFSEKSVPIILPRYRVQDIDTVEDWIRAEMMHKILQNQ